MDSQRRRLILSTAATVVATSAPAHAVQTPGIWSTRANGLEFQGLTLGEGPLALCLHGFPDSPWTYRHLMPELARAGYRVVVPYMRGYAPTGIPANADYSTRALAADVNALHAALGGDERAVLVAHDWGAVAAYGALGAAPERWRRAAIMNVPPLAVFGQVAFRYEQLKRSFYFWLFQMQIADGLVAANDLAFLEGLWRDWSPDFDPTPEMARVKACLRDPAHLKAALGYYRTFFDPASFGGQAWSDEQGAVLGRAPKCPTLYLHGTRDGCIALDDNGAASVRGVLPARSAVERIPGVGHFMLVEAPRQINARILAFLS
jgi:pimeloyl-ACP methyl ester carboxylesterase